jgi:hypothetical protein
MTLSLCNIYMYDLYDAERDVPWVYNERLPVVYRQLYMSYG